MEQSLLSSAIRTMMQTDRMHRQLLDESRKVIGLHRTAHIILMHLSKNKAASQKELADRVGITPAAVTGILKHLEREGYITRCEGRDSRYHEIDITELGRDAVLLSRKVFSEVDTALFDGFSDEELSSYIKTMEKIQINMENYRKGGTNTK